MDIGEYISSGIVESYVLGMASAEERSEFERMCAAHAEVRVARESFELALEKQAMQDAVAPPGNLKTKIFSEIEMEKDADANRLSLTNNRTAPAVIRPAWSRFTAAAALILLAASTFLNYYFYSKYRDYTNRYDELLASQTQTAAVNRTLQVKLQDYESAMNLMKDPVMAIVKMPGAPTSPNPSSMATIYWNTHSKDVYLLVNNLPRPANNKQYQLWAMVDGKPVDAGVFDISAGMPFVKMKNIQVAQAFAITLEKKGGSATPTMDAMFVMGKVTG